MSKLIKKPINIPDGIIVKSEGDAVVIQGPKGSRELPLLPATRVIVEGATIKVENLSEKNSANSGTMYSLLKNAITGIAEGFTRYLEIEGVGFKAGMEGNTLVLSLGFVNPVKLIAPAGITIAVEEKNVIKISGIDKNLVGQIAAQVRAFKKPEPYKGKGIHYRGEFIRRKVGKKAGATTSA